MKKKLIVLVVALAVLIAGLRPYVSASFDDFGLAIGWRTSVHQKYQHLVLWEFANK